MPGARLEDLVAGEQERAADGGADRGVVLDYQDTHVASTYRAALTGSRPHRPGHDDFGVVRS